MVLHEIINEVINTSPKGYGQLIIPDNFIWDKVLFNGHIQMGLLMVGLWTLLDLFDYLFWDDWRVIRSKIKERVKLWIHNLLSY